MTTLVTEQMYNDTPLEQEIRVYKSFYAKVIRFQIYKEGVLPDGILTLEIYDGVNLLSSKQITYEDINEITTSKYWHGYVSFEFDDAVFLSVNKIDNYKEYTLKLTLSDHTDSDEKYIGVCRCWEKYLKNTLEEFRYAPLYGNETSDGITASFSNSYPLNFEIYNLE